MRGTSNFPPIGHLILSRFHESSQEEKVGNSLSQSLLEILRCPACEDRPKVELKDGKLVCVKCGRAYPIINGIPKMLVEDAEMLEVEK